MKRGNTVERKLNCKVIVGLFLVTLLIILLNLVGGRRFTPIEAIKSSSFIKGDIKIFGEIDRSWVKAYLLEAQNGVKTAVIERKGLMWSCPSVTYFYDDIIKNDKVKTVGWASIAKNRKQITVFAVQADDPNVKFIEAGPNSDRQRKSIALNETIIFTWDKLLLNNDINAIAFDEDNQQVYKYGYNPEYLNFTNLKDLRWYSLNNR